jgi:hypothetical protein
MDPYLESRWSGVHTSLITLVTEALQPLLPRDLRARPEERVLLEDASEQTGSYRTDIAVVDLGNPSQWSASSQAAATVEPVRIQFYREPDVERFIQIIDVVNGNRVVTAIEILSAANKRRRRSNQEYRKEIEDYNAAGVNIVEIDLLRAPARDYLPVTDADIPVRRRGAYVVCVNDAKNPLEWLAYPISLRDPLPTIPIPLRAQDAPVMLALQPLIERAYVIGGHDDIDYTKPPVPALDPEDVGWAKEVVAQAVRA